LPPVATKLTQSPWFLKDGFVNVFHPPSLHWSFEVGVAAAGTCRTPLLARAPEAPVRPAYVTIIPATVLLTIIAALVGVAIWLAPR
jgi:hypothetical protein